MNAYKEIEARLRLANENAQGAIETARLYLLADDEWRGELADLAQTANAQLYAWRAEFKGKL